MGQAIKHPVPDRVKPSFVMHFDAQPWASECPDVKNLNDGLTRSGTGRFYSCTHKAAVGVNVLTVQEATQTSMIQICSNKFAKLLK